MYLVNNIKMYLILGITFCLLSIFHAEVGGNEVKLEKSTMNYTMAEIKALEEFRPQVINLIPLEYERTDAYLIQWLRARKLDVSKAVELVQTAVKWRKENNIDNIQNETILEINPVPYEIGGYDREGLPLVILTPTSVDFRGLLIQGVSINTIYRYFIQVVERGVATRRPTSLKFGKEITQGTIVIDFAGFNLRQHGCVSCIPVFRDLLIAFETYYPGVLKHIVCINVPRIALPILEILKPVLSESTLKALKIFGPDKVEWSKYLHSIIPPDQLPYRFGGTKKV
jgi:hypothetical protein